MSMLVLAPHLADVPPTSRRFAQSSSAVRRAGDMGIPSGNWCEEHGAPFLEPLG